MILLANDEIGWIQILLLALIQGITEFLPISSSGHLILLPQFANLADQGLVIDIAAHFGTLMAVCLFFRSEVASLFTGAKDIAKRQATKERQRLLYLAIGTLPIVVAGFIFKDFIESTLRSPLIIGATMLGWGLVLGVSDKFFPEKQLVDDMTAKDAFLIGCAQVLALVPGTSRSGITMTASRFLGMKRTEGARFSLLLSIPTILAAVFLLILDAINESKSFFNFTFIAVTLLSFIVAYITLKYFMKWIESRSFTPFVIYRVVLGILIFYWFW